MPFLRNSIYVWIAKPEGGFNVWSKWSDVGVAYEPDRFQLGDFNGDGRVDHINFQSDGDMYVEGDVEVDGEVFVKAKGLKPGDFVRVKITDTLEYDLVGEHIL